MALGTLGMDDDNDGQGTDDNTNENYETLDEQRADDAECYDDPRDYVSPGDKHYVSFKIFNLQSIVDRATILTDELKAGLRRVQSSKEGPAAKTFENTAKPDGRGDENHFFHSFSRTKSTSAVTGPTTGQGDDDATFLNGLIGEIKAGVDILERNLSEIFGSESSPRESEKSYRNYSATPSDRQPDQPPISDLSNESSPVEEVDLIVPKTDDPSIAYCTFRVVVLGLFSCILVTFLNTYFSFRAEPVIISTTSALVITAPLGKLLESTLPHKFVRVPLSRWGFSLNPGPFTIKEHTLITICASAGSFRPGGVHVQTLIKVFLRGNIDFLPAFVVTLTCELLGYGWSILLYKFLVEPAIMWWPSSIINVSLIRGLYLDKGTGVSPLRFFGITFIGAFAYYVIPGHFIPSVSTVSVVCLIFKHNVLAQQLGSGARGLGLGAVSFNWAAISGFQGSPLVVPWKPAMNMFVGVLIQTYVLVPITYWKNWFQSKNLPIFSTNMYTRSGQVFNVSRILNTDNLRRNEDAFTGSEQDLTYVSAFFSMTTGMSFALCAAVFSHVILYYGKSMLQIFKRTLKGQSESMDVHTKLMRRYSPIPMWWGVVVLLASSLASAVNLVAYKDQVDMKVWGLFLAFGLTILMLVPVTVLVATTNQIAHLGVLPQYLMGLLQEGQPVANALFRTYSSLVCSRTSAYLTSFKFGHYMRVPPIATFYAQLCSTVVAALVSSLVTVWLTESVANICDTTRLPRNTPWTCPVDKFFYDQTITFGLVGTKRLFTKVGAPYRALNLYILAGILVPALARMLTWALPQQRWVWYINGPLLIRGAYLMPPSPVANNMMWLLVALFFGTYVFYYHRSWWRRYNFCLSAALDSGTVAMALLQYYSLDEGKKQIQWWGRRSQLDHCPLASCPRGHGIRTPGCPVY